MNEHWGHFVLIDDKPEFNDISPPKPLMYDKSDKDDKNTDYLDTDYDDDYIYNNDLRKINIIIFSRLFFYFYSFGLFIVNSCKSIVSKVSFSNKS